jgi:hypothetical protein
MGWYHLLDLGRNALRVRRVGGQLEVLAPRRVGTSRTVRLALELGLAQCGQVIRMCPVYRIRDFPQRTNRVARK